MLIVEYTTFLNSYHILNNTAKSVGALPVSFAYHIKGGDDSQICEIVSDSQWKSPGIKGQKNVLRERVYDEEAIKCNSSIQSNMVCR